MNDFLNQIFLDNPIRAYLIVVGIIFVTFLFKRYLSRFIAGLIFSLVKRVAQGVDKSSFIRLVVRPMETFLLLLISIVSIDKLNFPKLFDVTIYKIHLHQLIDAISVIVLIVVFIWLLLRMIDFIAMILNQKAERPADVSDNQLVVFFKDLFKVLFVIMGVLMILKMAFHYKISNLITALSIGGAALALSFRESLENLIASFIIFFDKPFMVGDVVKVHEITGTVEKIGLRSTRIRTDQFVQRVRNILQQRKDQVENFTVFLADINKNAFILHVEFFTAPIPVAEFNNIRQEVNLMMIELMEEMNIKLATKESDAPKVV
jgi:MscS family membrane protein